MFFFVYIFEPMKDIYKYTVKYIMENEIKSFESDDLIRLYCSIYQLNEDNMRLNRDNKALKNDKAILSYLIFVLCHLSIVDISKKLGLKNHSTVSSDLKRVRVDFSEDEGFRSKYKRTLERICENHTK